MKISILSPDLSSNCLGRAYLLAKILQRHYKIEIVGPLFTEKIWPPVAKDKTITYKFIKITGRIKAYWELKDLLRLVKGDIIYAVKPLFTSFGIGILLKIIKKKPLILDIDDWQMGFVKEYDKGIGFVRRYIFSAIQFYNMASYWNSLIGENLTYFADEITVSNNFLKKSLVEQLFGMVETLKLLIQKNSIKI